MSASTASLIEDFAEPWADDFAPITTTNAATANDPDDFNDAWGDEDAFSMPTKSSTEPTATPATFDDKGEPDFAGWLNAQTQAKAKKKNPLPKGLANTSSRPVAGARSVSVGPTAGTGVSTNGNANVKKVGANGAAKAKAMAKKAEPDAPVEDDEGWGDAWE